ncbi:agglutinin alpha chain [Morus notabilis]|nr:agglutinin alpha chain [Morus notabilis]
MAEESQMGGTRVTRREAERSKWPTVGSRMNTWQTLIRGDEENAAQLGPMAGTNNLHTSTAKSQTIVVGNWGGPGGTGWDDGSYTGIREIDLSHKDAIGSLSVIYDVNGTHFPGPKHIVPGAYTKEKIVLQFPQEFIVSVSGYTGSLPGHPVVVRSLTIKTNKRTLGPYGVEQGTPFSFPIANGLIVGFKGSSGDLLDSIGFHLSL